MCSKIYIGIKCCFYCPDPPPTSSHKHSGSFRIGKPVLLRIHNSGSQFKGLALSNPRKWDGKGGENIFDGPRLCRSISDVSELVSISLLGTTPPPPLHQCIRRSRKDLAMYDSSDLAEASHRSHNMTSQSSPFIAKILR